VELTCVTVDCASPEKLVRFWSEALGWEIQHSGTDGAYCKPLTGGPGLEFIPVPESKTTKNRLHLGTRHDDLDTEIRRLIGLGARVAWEEEFPVGWPYRNVVLQDPEGNEFCLGNEPRT
jgi:predicted enzyme related to lactoylglutathione lyase